MSSLVNLTISPYDSTWIELRDDKLIVRLTTKQQKIREHKEKKPNPTEQRKQNQKTEGFDKQQQSYTCSGTHDSNMYSTDYPHDILTASTVVGEQWEKLHRGNLGIHIRVLKWPNSQVQQQIDNSRINNILQACSRNHGKCRSSLKFHLVFKTAPYIRGKSHQT